MSAEIIYGVFDNVEAAAYTVDELKARGLDKSLTVVGPEYGELRPITSKFIDKKHNSFFAHMIIGGAILGFAAGILGVFIPGIAASGPGPFMAAISGASAGAYLGLVAAAIAHFDVPRLTVDVYEHDVPAGTLMLAVRTDTAQHEQIEDVLDRGGAIEIDRRIAA